MSNNRRVLKEILHLSAKLKPEGETPFTNHVYIAASSMLADYPPSEDRKDGLTNHERMLRNKAKREKAKEV